MKAILCPQCKECLKARDYGYVMCNNGHAYWWDYEDRVWVKRSGTFDWERDRFVSDEVIA